MAFSGLITLLNLMLCLVIGIRLLRIGLNRDRQPERALAVYFLASAFLSTICQAIAYGALVDPRLALLPSTSRWVLGLGILGMAVGGVGVLVFTWLSFRRDDAWASRAVIVGSLIALGGWVFEALHEGFAITLTPGIGHWVAWFGRTAPVVWVAVESLRYWIQVRRRLRIGLANPVVVNRFFLWAIWSFATLANLSADPAARILYWTWAGTSTEVVMTVIEPVVIGTMAVTMMMGAVSVVTLVLTFFPTITYRNWIVRRAEAVAGI